MHRKTRTGCGTNSEDSDKIKHTSVADAGSKVGSKLAHQSTRIHDR